MFSNGTKELSSNNSNNELYHTSKGLQITCCWGWQASHSTHAKGLVVIVETSQEWKEYSKKKRVLHICTFRMWLIIDDSGKREPGLNTGFASTYWPVYILWSAMVTYFILRKSLHGIWNVNIAIEWGINLPQCADFMCLKDPDGVLRCWNILKLWRCTVNYLR